jgi:hypothetical protein
MTWEPVKAEDTQELLCEIVHTGLRKGTTEDEFKDAEAIWDAILHDKSGAWGSGMFWAVYSLESMGYRLCKEQEVK